MVIIAIYSQIMNMIPSIIGKGTEKAFEAFKYSEALDAFQDGWHLGTF